ncbi:PAS domain S-box protein [Schauerella aestuarii]|uniref:PAS domain S-box protein n=1 Tax=Schauerella aestuarii TaxID=2511204 RepID=UPI001928883D|nr:PAS domain S-box protein [Achromobacter aestuarii]
MQPGRDVRFLDAGGEMGTRIRDYPWSDSPLGATAQWPQSLRTAIGLMLRSKQPVYIAWGPRLISFYNDAYIPFCAAKHPIGLGMPFAELWSEVWEELRPLVTATLGGDAQWVKDMPIVLPGCGADDVAWFSFSWVPLLDDAGDVGGMYCVATDTTETVLSQQRLRDLNADLERQIALRAHERSRTWHISPDLLSIFGMSGCFESANPAWTATLGWEDSELIGRHYTEFVHPDDRAETEEVVRQLASGLPLYRFENRYRCRNGSYRWLSWFGVTENNRFFCSARDVTQAKMQAAELATRTAERDRLWELSDDLLVVADYEGRLLRVSPSWTRVLGYGESELYAMHYRTILHPDDFVNVVSEAFDIMRATGESRRIENRLLRRDGTWRWFAWTISPEPGGDRLTGVGRDISVEKERQLALASAQDALRQAQKMEAVGQLTGGLAHDFNNLLTGITGSLELLKLRLARGETQGIERYVETAQGAAKRAASLTHRLLAFSRRQTLDPRHTDVNRLVADMDELIRRTVGPQIATLQQVAPALWTTLVDRNQLESALLNLCINARDAMPDGGRLTIATSNDTLDDKAAGTLGVPVGDYVTLAVTDDGCGMTPEDIARAFDPFFTTKPIGQGTGLGLSMVYGFAQQSDGVARIVSQVGHGTTVQMYLPRRDADRTGHTESPHQDERCVPPTSGVPSAGEASAPATVLVIDDEPAIRMLAAEVLEELGYATLQAEDGPSGLALLRSPVAIDLLITDVGLPNGMNGRQVADAAKVLRPALKVLFITGYAENAVLNHGDLDAGMQVLTKPFAMEVFARRVADLIALPLD